MYGAVWAQCQAKPSQAAGRKYPAALLSEMMNAVLDDNMGELMEYRHLIRNPAYKEIWTQSMGKEIG